MEVNYLRRSAIERSIKCLLDAVGGTGWVASCSVLGCGSHLGEGVVLGKEVV